MAQSNNTPHPAAHMVRYVFPSDTFNGSMIEDAGGNTVYRITTKTKLSGSTTTITRPDETPVGVIRWRYLFRPMAVTLNGKEIPKKQVLYTQRSGFFSAPKQLWTDDDGKEFHWKRGSCYDSNDRVIARYTPTVIHMFSKNEPATLSIDSQYVPVLEKLLVTTLMVEHWRRQRRSDEAGADGGGSSDKKGSGGGGGDKKGNGGGGGEGGGTAT
ncbi:hypothetical protein FRB95_001876 [Tulasnella sp. JGI-2019a]|nr:hypothetical protein FRB95_001876 [Tulasnella sp. JGI-2019a]